MTRIGLEQELLEGLMEIKTEVQNVQFNNQ